MLSGSALRYSVPMPTWPPPEPADQSVPGPRSTYPRPTPRHLMPYDPSYAVAAARLPHLRATRAPRDPRGPFAGLTWPQQRTAEAYLYRFCQRWGSDLPPWRYAILCGVAKRLALHPPPPGWGRRMHKAQGGLATMRRAKAAGLDTTPNVVAARAALAEKRRAKREGSKVMPKGQLRVD